MQTAPVMPPPRPPRDGNVLAGSYDWHDNPNAGWRARWSRMGLIGVKYFVFLLLAVAVGQLAFIIFQTVRLQLFA